MRTTPVRFATLTLARRFVIARTDSGPIGKLFDIAERLPVIADFHQ